VGRAGINAQVLAVCYFHSIGPSAGTNLAAFKEVLPPKGLGKMGRHEMNADVDMADGTEDPPLDSWGTESALEKWERLERAQGKRQGEREGQC
jgi:hypothetical protein